VVLESLEAGESSSSGNHFMSQAGLILVKVVVLVYLLVVVFVLVCTIKVNVRISPMITKEDIPQKPIVTI
jgi:hypothetical protein